MKTGRFKKKKEIYKNPFSSLAIYIYFFFNVTRNVDVRMKLVQRKNYDFSRNHTLRWYCITVWDQQLRKV